MKALSIRQPWAWLICIGYKDIENRIWPTKLRERIYVHAGKTMDVNVPNMSLTESWILDRLTQKQRDTYQVSPRCRGAIIGEVDIVGCKFRDPDENANLYSTWHEPGMYGFILKNPMLYTKPIPYKGSLGFFEVKL